MSQRLQAQASEPMPVISIVIPAFNVVPYLDACLRSVMREVDAARALGEADFEIIVVDDCSSDATAELARDLLGDRKDARVATHERNRGPAAARNTALDMSRGDYLLFIDSDNTLLEGALLRVINALSEHGDADAIILAMDTIDERGDRTGAFYGDRVPANPVERLQSNPFLLLDGNIMDAFCIIRASVARMARYDETLCHLSDWDFYLRLHHEHRCRFAMLEDPVGGYRLRSGQLSQLHTAQNQSGVRETLRIHSKALAMALRLDLPAPVVQRLLAAVQNAGSAYLQLAAGATTVAAPAPSAAPAEVHGAQPTSPAVVELVTVQLNFGARTVPFAFRGSDAGDKGAVARAFENNDYGFAHCAQGRRFLEFYAANVGSKPGLVIDAGANIGAATVYFLESLANSFLCALEPEPIRFGILELNTKAYRNKTNLRAAIAARDGQRRLVEPDVSVAAVSVPSILKVAAATVPMIFKCDIGGGEDDVFSADPQWMHLFPVLIVGPGDRMRAFSGAAHSFLRAVAQHDFDLIPRGESVFLFNRALLA